MQQNIQAQMRFESSLVNGDGKFKMEIADNGLGINEEEKQKGHHGIENMELRAKEYRMES